MPSIYDVAARLDNSGIMAPARMNAARIAISEQAAREAPARFQQEQKQWQRADEQYAQGQMLFKQQQTFTRAAQIAAVSQTPQAFARNLQRVLGDQIGDPYWSSVLNEASAAAGDPLAWQRMKSEIGSSMTNVGNLFASQLKMREEQAQQDAMTRRSMYEQGQLNARSSADIAGRERTALIQSGATRYSADKRLEGIKLNVQAKIDEKLSGKNLSATDRARVRKAVTDELMKKWSYEVVDKEAGTKSNKYYANAPFVNPEYQVYEEGPIEKFVPDWIPGGAADPTTKGGTFNEDKFEALVQQKMKDLGVETSTEKTSTTGAKPKFSIMGNP
jgi:hypothetical protein